MTRETRLNLVKGPQGRLYPADPETGEAIKAFSEGELIPCKVFKERNPKFHRKFFAMLQTAFENQERYQSFDEFRAAVTVAAGHTEMFTPANGGALVFYPKSVAWDKMDDIEFAKLYSAALDAILRDFIPGTDPQAFQNAVDEVCRFA